MCVKTRPQNFKSMMKGAGLAVMELVAMELKRKGRYLARMLGFHDVQFSLLQASMDPRLVQVGPAVLLETSPPSQA